MDIIEIFSWNASDGVRFGQRKYMYDKGTFTCAERTRAENWLQTQIITCVHTCAVAERRRSGSKIYSATNGSTLRSKPSLSSRNGRSARVLRVCVNLPTVAELRNRSAYIEGILPKGPYLPCVSMAGRALLAGYPRYVNLAKLPQ